MTEPAFLFGGPGHGKIILVDPRSSIHTVNFALPTPPLKLTLGPPDVQSIIDNFKIGRADYARTFRPLVPGGTWIYIAEPCTWQAREAAFGFALHRLVEFVSSHYPPTGECSSEAAPGVEFGF